ncbi:MULTISPECIES: ABC transporter permease [Streptomyces]|uniref:ABC transporter permease n=1 Tax=Streptomyces evansiae TaxID=3075535 RepID=A0ABD5E259_9ACTN|nr:MULTISPECIES: ABC transporter permease [unclassified Streptomyces]ASY31832.1 nickel ABC transporter permease [Streptomyces sp. CLI2509]EFL03731.1 nickel ABC transporter, permease subunit NikC [Streptomyces sp. SPB78]MDT0410159.1 ABC transporter permease [Streptomyces sp. DSM 41979]MDT0414722.1 ABC transporter permease [Streptomyces sp. DSM 41982]MDT0421084.1 ABC transporter permease [Streptomyces sp. DSM 41859]
MSDAVEALVATGAVPETPVPPRGGEKRRGLMAEGLRRTRSQPFFILSVLIIAAVGLMAVAPGLFTRTDPRDCSLIQSRLGPRAGHPFGFDMQGCDYFSNVVHGARISLEVGLLVALFTFVIATVAGALAGYFGGLVDTVISRIADIVLGVPVGIASLVILYQFRSRTVWTIVFVLVLFTWAGTMRYLRGSVLQVKQLEYVQAARVLGVGHWGILRRHVVPNAITPLVVMSTLGVGAAMTAEAGFSILGVGIKLPTFSWGVQIAAASTNGNWQIAPHLMFFPAGMLGLTTLAFVVLGENLRDVLDPRGR